MKKNYYSKKYVLRVDKEIIFTNKLIFEMFVRLRVSFRKRHLRTKIRRTEQAVPST